MVKRILHVIDTTGPGGAETVFVSLADHVRRQGYDSVALVRGDGWVKDELELRGVTIVILDDRVMGKIKYLREFIKIIRSYEIDIIQSHLLGANLYSALAGLITRTPVVASFHGMVDIGEKERGLKIKFALMNLAVSRYVFVSDSLNTEFLQKYPVHKKKGRVIYNGIDTSLYQLPKSLKIKQDLNISDSSVLVGSLGNIRRAKAYERVLQVAHLLRLKGRGDIQFVIVGHQKKDLMDELNSLSKKLDVGGSVHFLGFSDDTPDYLCNLDIFLLSSSSEGFSIATIEAMSAGLPVIATECGGPEEIIASVEEGVLVENGNVEALAAAVVELADDQEKAASIGRSARVAAHKRFDLQSMVLGYTEEYSRF